MERLSLLRQSAINAKPIWHYIALFISGGLSVFGLAPFFFWPAYALGIVILITSLDAAQSQKLKRRALFWRGFAFAFGYFAFGMFWVGAAFLVDAEKFAWLLPVAIMGLPAFLALYWGLGALAFGALKGRGAFRAFWFAACFATMEFLRANLLTGLPWNLPAYIWNAGGIISQNGFLIGPYGVSLFTLFVFAAFAMVGRARYKMVMGAAFCITAFAIGFGVYRLESSKSFAPAPTAPIIAVGQGGYSQRDLWIDGNQTKVAQTYLNLLESSEAKAANVIIWPEGAFPFLPLEEAGFMGALNQKLGTRTLIFGAVRREPNMQDKDKYFNSMAILHGADNYPKILGLYDKFHLVPFGEYLPFRRVFDVFGMTSLVATGDAFTPSKAPQILNVKGLPLIDPRICYEIIFPHFQKPNSSRADWIINISVDAWYGDLLGPDQHYNQARWRAIEEGLPMVRAASGGWSSITDSFGRPVVQTRQGNKLISANLPSTVPAGIYFNYGEKLFAIFCILFACLVLIIAKKDKEWYMTDAS